MKDAYINLIGGLITLFAAVMGVIAALINANLWKPDLTFNLNLLYILLYSLSIALFIVAFYLFKQRKKHKFHPIIVSAPTKKYYFKEMPLEKGVYWNAYTEDYPVEKKFKNKLRVNIDGNPHCPECKTEFNVSKGLFGYTWKCPMCGKKMRFRENLWDEKESVKRIIKSTILRYFENS